MTGYIARILHNGVEARIGPYGGRQILLEAIGKFLDERTSVDVLAMLWRDNHACAGRVGVIVLEEVEAEFDEMVGREATKQLADEEIEIRAEYSE